MGPAAGNSTTTQTYRFAQSLSFLGGSTGTYCFQLIATDFDGSTHPSDTICVFVTNNTTPVWPGDANSDGTADVRDLLYIGAANGNLGPIRPSASLNWTGQPAPAWPDSFASHLNYRYADCDGNGAITLQDTLAITQNYGLTHNKTEMITANGIPFTLVFPDSANSRDTLEAQVWLGNTSTPANNAYGFAFSLRYDPTQVDSGKIWVNIDSSFLGNANNDLVSMHRNFHNDGQFDFGLTRTDGTNRSGYGKIATITIVMVDNLSKTNFDAEVRMFPTRPWLIDRKGTPYPVSLLLSIPSALPSPPAFSINLFPIPTQGKCKVKYTGIASRQVSFHLRDLQGRTIQTLQQTAPTLADEWEIDLGNHAPGTYLLEISDGTHTLIKKVILF